MRDVAMTDAEGEVPTEHPIDWKITIVCHSLFVGVSWRS